MNDTPKPKAKEPVFDVAKHMREKEALEKQNRELKAKEAARVKEEKRLAELKKLPAGDAFAGMDLHQLKKTDFHKNLVTGSKDETTNPEKSTFFKMPGVDIHYKKYE